MTRCIAGGLVGVAIGMMALPAFAQTFPDEPARLEYERRSGAESCPDEEAFRQYVEIWRHGRDNDFLPADPYDHETVVVRVTLERAGGKFRGTITHVPPAGTPAEPPETMINFECEDLVEHLAFKAGFFLPFNHEPPAEPCPTCPSCPRAEPCEPEPAAPACDPRRKGDPANDKACRALQAELNLVYGVPVDPAVWLSAGGLMTLVYTSDPGGGFSLGADLRGKHWSVGIEAQVTLPAPVRIGVHDFDNSSFVGMLVPCARFGETVVFVGCGAIGAGGLLSNDSQETGQPSPFGATVRLGPRLGLEVPFAERFAFYAYGEVSFAPILARRTYLADGSQWVQSAASVFLAAGFSVRLTD